MSTLRLSAYAAAASIALGIAASAHAGPITGSVWENDFSDNADIVPGGAPSATFTITGAGGINYDSTVGGYTIGGFLSNVTLSNPIGGDGLNNTHIQFTGSTFLNAGNNAFVIPHDDGLRLVMGGGIGTVLDQPGPTSPVNTPFNVFAPSAGFYTFTLDYNECCGPPARLEFDVNGGLVGVPEPATLCLVGFGLAGVGFGRRNRKR